MIASISNFRKLSVALLAGAISTVSVAQTTLVRHSCPDSPTSTFIYDDIKADKSDGYCDSGTEMSVVVTGQTSIGKVTVKRLDGGPHRAQVDVTWNSNLKGTITVVVQYRKRIFRGLPKLTCKWTDWRYMYTYQITRDYVNPEGTITGNLTATAPSNQTVSVFNLFYNASSTYPNDLKITKIRYVNGNASNAVMVETPIVPIRTIYTPPYNPTPIVFNATGTGSFTVQTEVYNSDCNKWYTGPTALLQVDASCYVTDFSNVTIEPIANTGEPAVIPYTDLERKTFGLNLNQTYTMNVTNISNFSTYYDWSFVDFGSGNVTTNGDSFTPLTVGDYSISIISKNGKKACDPPLVIDIWAGITTANVNIIENCSVTLPADISHFYPQISENDNVFQHFPAYVKSKRSVIITPGITLDLGAELFIEDDPDAIETDKDINFTELTSYDEYGDVMGATRSYFDDNGLPTQTQYKNLTNDVILANATLYDLKGRVAISTLPAPIVAPQSATCLGDAQKGSKKNFLYKDDFVQADDANDATPPLAYVAADFDGTNENTPLPLDASQEGTLGWYYSKNNVSEPLTATTQYPYSRTLFKQEDIGQTKGVTIPGDVFKAGSSYLATSDQYPVDANDPFFDTSDKSYLSIRYKEFQLPRPSSIAGSFYKTIAYDAVGKKSVSYADRSGKEIISVYYGDQETAVTTSYQFYDNAGRLLASISPNGLNDYQVVNGVSNFDVIDKTRYFYDGKGRLAAMEEKIAGQAANGVSRTEYVYRTDGAIRFSQNQEQQKAIPQRYSYTNYDNVGRPVESGEYEVGPGGIAFKSQAMMDILENREPDGGIADNMGVKRERMFSFYDEPDPNVPDGRVQRFVHGAVSYTKKDNYITTWYSYDENGRLEWMAQGVKGMDVGEGVSIKTLDYRFGPTGQVQDVIYQKGNVSEQFTHFYEYDADGRLRKTYTTRELLDYNIKGELTNPAVLEHHATYYYYLHGPLKRVELATKTTDGVTASLQGIDYLYTADGALKAINHADPTKDPGKDGSSGSSVGDDAFGMILDYYPNDYVGAADGVNHEIDNVKTLTTPGSTSDNQYTGLIKATRWHGPVQPDQTFAYVYGYDNRNQFTNARWGTVDASTFTPTLSDPYHESIGSYDANGNINSLQRNSNLIKAQNYWNYNLVYNYAPFSNTLTSISQTKGEAQVSETFRSYEYNDLGQMTRETEGSKDKYVVYDVTGKVTGVYKDAPHTKPVTTFLYDDRGFRLSKTNYDENFAPAFATWYVRDASGNVVTTYEQDLVAMTPPKPIEVPVYGSGKLGLYKPDYGMTFYELTDHLGNVRAVLGEGLTAEYLATMETERNAREVNEDGFINDVPSYAPSYANHTTAVFEVDNQTEEIKDPVPDEVCRINNRPNGISVPNPVGTGIMLLVHPGDKINASVFAMYSNFDENDNNVLNGLSGFLTTAFSTVNAKALIDGASLFNVLNDPGFAPQYLLNKLDESQPRAFLNYLFFDKNLVLQEGEKGFDFDQVTNAAAVNTLNPPLSTHEELSLEVTVEKEGYIYIYVSNDSDQNMEVYFDDLRVKQTFSTIAAGGDFYPFGLSIKDREITREPYRYGYQGQNAEKDEETGWNHFELREYDPITGRWLSVDPKKIGWSPYVGMDNNPVNRTDPDGGCPGGCPPTTSLSASGLLGSLKPSFAPHNNITLGYGYGAKGRVGSYSGNKADVGVDVFHAMYSFGTDGANLQLTGGSAAFKIDDSFGNSMGAEGYVFRANFGNKGNNWDYFGDSSAKPFPSSGVNFIDNDPPNIIDLGFIEFGWDFNYSPRDFINDTLNSVKDYFNSYLQTVDVPRYDQE